MDEIAQVPVVAFDRALAGTHLLALEPEQPEVERDLTLPGQVIGTARVLGDVDADGELRLTMRVLDWDGYVRLSFDEIRLAGAGSPQVARGLRAVLEDLKTVVPPARRPALDRQLDLLSAAVTRRYSDDRDRRAALTPDNEGIGSGPDVVMSDGQHASWRGGCHWWSPPAPGGGVKCVH